MDNSTWEVTSSSNVPSGEEKVCPNCGEKSPKAAFFCPYCGFRFDSFLSDNDPESEMTTVLQDQKDVSTYELESSISSVGKSQHLYEYDAAPYESEFNIHKQPTKKRKSVLPIIAIISATVLAMFLGFFVIAPLIADRIGDGPEPVSTGEPAESVLLYDSKAETSSAVTTTAIPIPEATVISMPTSTPTPIPTATPTPLPTATPTEVPPQTISQPNIIDASTGQPIAIPNDTAESFAYPDSGSRVWSYGDVNGMTAGQVRYCINEIYAKHGYIFQNENWLNYFKQKTWYSPTVPKASFGDNYLNANEVANVKLLNQYYEDRKFPDY